MKRHHNSDYAKNRTADVIPKGFGPVVPQEHYEVNMNLTPAGSNRPDQIFNPRPGKDRPTMYPKTNECDH